MPILDTHISGEQLRSPRQVDDGKPFRQLGALAQDIGSAIETRDQAKLEFDTRMQMAEQKNQVDEAKLNTKMQFDLLQEEYTQDPIEFSKDNPDAYQERLTDIVLNQGDTIQSDLGRQVYQDDIKDIANKYSIIANKVRNDTIIARGKSNLDNIQQQLWADPNRNGKLTDELMRSGEFGIIDSGEAQERSQNTIMSWAVRDAETSIDGAKAVLRALADPNDSRYPLESENKTKAFDAVNKIVKRQETVARMDRAIGGIGTQSSGQEIVARKDLNTEQKYQAILALRMSDKDQKTAIANLESSRNIDPYTNSRKLALFGWDLTALKKDFQPGTEITQEEDATKYLGRIQKIKDDVIKSYTNGELSHTNYLQLTDNINAYSTAKIAQSRGALQEEDVWDWGWGDDFENADAISMFNDGTDQKTADDMFANYYTSLGALETNKSAQSSWEKKTGEKWDNTPASREKLAISIEEKQSQIRRNSAYQLTTEYSEFTKAKDERTDEEILTAAGFTEQDVLDTMEARGDTREQVLQYVRDNG
jgi:hypothetical protein